MLAERRRHCQKTRWHRRQGSRPLLKYFRTPWTGSSCCPPDLLPPKSRHHHLLLPADAPERQSGPRGETRGGYSATLHPWSDTKLFPAETPERNDYQHSG